MGWRNSRGRSGRCDVGWAHRFKPPGGPGHGAATGPGLWGGATGTGSRAPFSADNQPPIAHVRAGRVNAEEYRAELAKRRAKVLAVLDNALAAGSDPKADPQMLAVGLRAAEAVADRLDGKPTQTISGDKTAPLTVVVRRFVEDVPD